MIGTITMGDTPIDVYGTVYPAEPDLGLMSDYVEIDDLQIGGVSVYELFASYGLLDKAEEYINEVIA
jgi:UDP-glucose 4-epimerase